MCVSPIKIPNPNYGNKTPFIVATKDTKSQYIAVPCHCCSECLMQMQMHFVQRARLMSMDHYLFFCTLTYDNKHLPYIDTNSGIRIRYADISDVQNMIKRIRKNNLFLRPFKFFFVSERGKETGRPHFHGLIFLQRYKDDDKLLPAQLETQLYKVLFKQWARNVGTRKFPIYEPLFQYHQKYVGGRLYKNFDLHYVVPFTTEKGSDDVAFYCSKYLLKPSNKEKRLQQALALNLDPDEYNSIWKLVKSKALCSKFFGISTDFEINYVKHCIQSSKDNPDGFQFLTTSGESQPMSKYLKRFVTESQYLDSVKATGAPYYLNRPLRDDSTLTQSVHKGDVIFEKVRKRDISDFFNN